MAAGSALFLHVTFALLKPVSRFLYGGPWAIVLAFLIPMLVVGPAVRILWGKRP